MFVRFANRNSLRDIPASEICLRSHQSTPLGYDVLCYPWGYTARRNPRYLNAIYTINSLADRSVDETRQWEPTKGVAKIANLNPD